MQMIRLSVLFSFRQFVQQPATPFRTITFQCGRTFAWIMDLVGLLHKFVQLQIWDNGIVMRRFTQNKWSNVSSEQGLNYFNMPSMRQKEIDIEHSVDSVESQENKTKIQQQNITSSGNRTQASAMHNPI